MMSGEISTDPEFNRSYMFEDDVVDYKFGYPYAHVAFYYDGPSMTGYGWQLHNCTAQLLELTDTYDKYYIEVEDADTPALATYDLLGALDPIS